MPLAALTLVLCSALIHSSWNALAKQSRDKFSFIWLAFLINGFWQLPYVAYCFWTGELSWSAWPWMLATTIAHSGYIYLLSESYRLGDYSLAYPISRGLGVALVPIAGLLLLKEELSAGGAAGVGLVIAGILFTGLSSTVGRQKASLAAVLAASGTGLFVASYNLVDKQAMLATGIHPLPWISLMMVSQTLALLPLALGRRDSVRTELKQNLRSVLFCAAGTFGGYLLVLFAFRLAPTAYVVASRESSIVFSVLIGYLLLGERQFKRRLSGALAIIAGVALIALLG
ncbi:MAG: EamA family transporter [Planctomycetales bacterium]|nr:EamA family transporter [bacterium]UNM07489.1 MAG: EamA family transporter [Planctomycetales bacterium]